MSVSAFCHWTELFLFPRYMRSHISLISEILSAVSVIVISKEGLISRNTGNILCLILFLVYFTSEFDRSSLNFIFFNARVFSYCFSGGKEERSDKIIIAWPHARKTCNSCSPCEVDKKGLDVVIKIVGNGDGIISMFTSDLFKPPVPQFSGSHLYGDTLSHQQIQWYRSLPSEM